MVSLSIWLLISIFSLGNILYSELDPPPQVEDRGGALLLFTGSLSSLSEFESSDWRTPTETLQSFLNPLFTLFSLSSLSFRTFTFSSSFNPFNDETPAAFFKSPLQLQSSSTPLQKACECQQTADYQIWFILFPGALYIGFFIGSRRRRSLSALMVQPGPTVWSAPIRTIDSRSPFSSFSSELSSSLEQEGQDEDLPVIQEEFLSNGYYAALFEHVQELGEGGFGSVELARHKLDGQLYAIKRQQMKIFGSQSIETHFLLNEVRSLVALQSKYVVKYSTCWMQAYQQRKELESSFSDSDGSVCSNEGEYRSVSLYIQMEYCRGHSLKQWLEDPRREIDQVFNQKVFKQVVKGVLYMHQNEILHRDLKPANILLDENQNAKIADFNLAIEGTDSLNKENVGTPLYSAPEQLKSKQYDFKADIFSLGVVLVELYSKFSTQHQRLIELGKARNGELPTQFVQAYPQQAVLAD